jgi:hypothetical protein
MSSQRAVLWFFGLGMMLLGVGIKIVLNVSSDVKAAWLAGILFGVGTSLMWMPKLLSSRGGQP